MKLVSTPVIGLMESPASWFSRLALSQSASLQEVRRIFGVPGKRDVDFFFSRKSFSAMVLKVVDVTAEDWQRVDYRGRFKSIELVLGRLKSIDPGGNKYLSGSRARPEYRYCPVCLAKDWVPYFRLEWRFRCWHWCPLHQCLLRDQCPTCGHRVVLPNAMFNAGTDGFGVGELSRCLSCEKLLTLDWQSETGTVPEEQMTVLERCMLLNGRAVLAALLKGYMCERGLENKQRLREINRYEQLRLIPNGRCPVDVARFNVRLSGAGLANAG